MNSKIIIWLILLIGLNFSLFGQNIQIGILTDFPQSYDSDIMIRKLTNELKKTVSVGNEIVLLPNNLVYNAKQ